MRLIMNAGHEHEIYGKKVRAGEEFDVPDNEARVWVKLGRAHAKSEEEPPKRGRPRKYEDSAARYDRRDMRAEDDE